MTRSIMGLVVLVCAALVGGCGNGEQDSARPAMAEKTPSAEGTVEAPRQEVIEDVTEQAADGGLPMAADVLPPDEVSRGSRAVLADGYRFQVPDGFAAAEVDVKSAESVYAGDVDGSVQPSRLTFYVTKETFSGSTPEYADQRMAQLGQVEGKEIRSIGHAFMQAAGQQVRGTRWRVENEQGIEMQQVYVHDGTAYTLHCAISNEPMNWLNVGSTCMVKGTTFHVAPPAD